MLVTGGAFSALAHVCTAFTSPNDVVLCESPTYHLAAARTMRVHGLRPAGVETDDEGIVPAALADALAAVRARASRCRGRP